jgi:hypothetical protein
MAQALSNAQVAILGDPILVKKLLFLNKFRSGSLVQNSIYVCSAAIGAPPNNLAHTLRCADQIFSQARSPRSGKRTLEINACAIWTCRKDTSSPDRANPSRSPAGPTALKSRD